MEDPNVRFLLDCLRDNNFFAGSNFGSVGQGVQFFGLILNVFKEIEKNFLIQNNFMMGSEIGKGELGDGEVCPGLGEGVDVFGVGERDEGAEF